MGKPTGFLDYERENNKSVEPLERIKNFNEFHSPMQKAERQKQGARCMNCGVPFCQSAMKLGGMVSGCPLHNLIPEWNDEIYNGNWEYALARLTKTASFPEFTGRVCPALCEAACSCGLYGSSVTVKENELAIIEEGYKNGWVKPHPPEVRTGKRVAVVGSGPSGLACAQRLNSRGHSVTVYEKDDRIGGLVLAFPDRAVADLCGNGFRRHFAAVNRADDAVTVSCRNHIHRNRTRQDEPLFNGLVAVAVADGDVAFGHARLKHRTVRAGCADDDRIGVVGAESLRSEFLADSECAFMIEQ